MRTALMLREFLILVIVLVMCSPITYAQNVCFIPGDAFFNAQLSKDTLDTIELRSGNLMLEYKFPSDDGNFGGFVGFSRLEIKNCPDDLVSRIKKTYGLIRRDNDRQIREIWNDDGTTRQIELNPVRLMVYNKAEDLMKIRVGLRYNESNSYPDDAFHDPDKRHKLIAGKLSEHIASIKTRPPLYSPFVREVEAIQRDLYHAKEFSGLEVEVPSEIGWGMPGPEIVEPITCDYGSIKILLFSSENEFKKFYHAKDGSSCYVISEATITECMWKKGTIQIKEISRSPHEN